MSKIEQLRKELNDARDRLVAKGWEWDGKSGNFMDIKPFEIAYQEAIEKVFPDYIWWQLTNYWDIFDAMMGGINDKDIIEEIISHIDPSVLDEDFEETSNGAKIESGHTIEEYREKFGKLYDDGELWDFSEEDLFDGSVEINPDIIYWKIEVDGEPRYFETCEECVEDDLDKEDTKSVAKLTEGTSNFPTRSDFDLLVFYTFDEFEDMVRNSLDYPNEEDYTQDLGGGDFHVDYEAYDDACQEFEDKMWEENEVCVLDEDAVERLEGKLEDFNEETKSIADERYDYDFEDNDERTYDDLANLDDIRLIIEPGYYEAAYIDVDNEDSIGYMSEAFGAKQKERIVNFLNSLREEFGLTKLGVAWGPASNGETGFKIIKEAKPTNKGKKKARFVGNPEAEKTFFNVANGTCTSCALSEAKKESYEEMFDELIDGVEFKLVKYSGEDRKSKSTWDDKEYEGDWGLIDTQGANLGGIEDERFNNAKEIIDSLDTYISDYFLGGQDGLEVSEEHQDELDDCYSYEEMLEFFKKYPEEDEDGYLVKLLDFIVNHAQDVDLEKCTYENFGESDKGSEVWVLKFIDKDGKQIKEMGKPMALDCTKSLAQKLVDTMNKYPARVGMTHEIEKSPYADTMSYEIIDSDDVEEWILKIEAEGKAAHGEESSESLKEELDDKTIFDILGIEEDNREKSKHLLSQFRELAKKHDVNKIYLKGDVGISAKGDVIDSTEDLAVVEESNESLKEDKEPELPKEVEVSIGELAFGGDFVDLEDDEISDLLSDYLSDTYGFCHKGFKWKGKEDSGDTLVCYDIEWDTSESLKEDKESLEDLEKELQDKADAIKPLKVKYNKNPNDKKTREEFLLKLDELVKLQSKIIKLGGKATVNIDEELKEIPFVCPRPAMKNKKIKEALKDSVSWFESVKCYGAPGDEPSNVYEPGQGAYCLVDENCNLVDSIEKHEREEILDKLIKGGSQFAIGDNEYEIEFSGDCDWDEAWPHILRMFKQGKLNGVFKLDKQQECKEEKTISSKVLKAHRK